MRLLLYILLLAALFLLTIFSIPVTLEGSFKESFKLVIGYGPVKKTVFPPREKTPAEIEWEQKLQEKKRKKARKKHLEKSKKQLQEASKEDFLKKHGVKDTVQTVSSAFVELLNALKMIAKFLKVSKFRLFIKITGDASQAAITYGEVCAILYPLFGLADNFLRINHRNVKIDIHADYLAEKDIIDFQFKTRINSFILFIIAPVAFFRFLIKQIKTKKK